MRATKRLPLLALAAVLVAVLPSCDSSNPVALEGDEIDLFPTFTEADTTNETFVAILMAVVRDPESGVRRQNVEVLFRVTNGAAQLSDTQVQTNDDGEAFIRVEGEGGVTIEATSGTATETIDLDATGGSIGENERPEPDLDISPSNPGINQQVTFDVSGTTDPDGDIDELRWQIVDFGDGSSMQDDVRYGTRTTETHTYNGADTYTVRLLVTDEDGASADLERDVTVGP